VRNWKSRLGNLLRDADTVAFVLSPSSARSEICAWEVGEAIRLGKRIIPVLCRPLDGASPPSQLADLNYIFFYEEPRSPGSGFGSGLVRLVAALNTDLDWLRQHTRCLQRASEWDAGGRPANRLLSGADVASAKAWAASRPKDAPEPTELHLDFIRASEAEESRQQSAEAQQLQQLAAAQAEREAAFSEKAAAQEREAEARRSEAESQKREAEQARRVVRRTRAGLAVAVVLAAAAGWFGFVAQQSANDARKEQDRAQRGLNQINATASRGVSTLVLRLQADASHPSRGDLPAASVTPLDHGVDGSDHVLSDAREQTKRSAKLLTNDDDIGAQIRRIGCRNPRGRRRLDVARCRMATRSSRGVRPYRSGRGEAAQYAESLSGTFERSRYCREA
jgi:hypothetical protein